MKSKGKSIMKCIMTFALTVAMVLGAVPLPFVSQTSLPVWADSGVINLVDDTETVTMKDGETYSAYSSTTIGTITVEGNAILQMISGRHTVTNGITVGSGATLTIEGASDGYFPVISTNISGDGTVIFAGGKLSVNGGKNSTAVDYDLIVNGGKLTVNGGVGEDGNSENGYSGQKGGDGIKGSVTVNGGTLTVKGGTGGSEEGKGGDGINGTVKLSGGTLTVTGGTPGSGGNRDGNGLSFKLNPYYVRDTDNVNAKTKKDGSLKSVKIKINGKDYKAKKTEFSFDGTKNRIVFDSENLKGSWTEK